MTLAVGDYVRALYDFSEPSLSRKDYGLVKRIASRGDIGVVRAVMRVIPGNDILGLGATMVDVQFLSGAWVYSVETSGLEELSPLEQLAMEADTDA